MGIRVPTLKGSTPLSNSNTGFSISSKGISLSLEGTVISSDYKTTTISNIQAIAPWINSKGQADTVTTNKVVADVKKFGTNYWNSISNVGDNAKKLTQKYFNVNVDKLAASTDGWDATGQILSGIAATLNLKSVLNDLLNATGTTGIASLFGYRTGSVGGFKTVKVTSTATTNDVTRSEKINEGSYPAASKVLHNTGYSSSWKWKPKSIYRYFVDNNNNAIDDYIGYHFNAVFVGESDSSLIELFEKSTVRIEGVEIPSRKHETFEMSTGLSKVVCYKHRFDLTSHQCTLNMRLDGNMALLDFFESLSGSKGQDQSPTMKDTWTSANAYDMYVIVEPMIQPGLRVSLDDLYSNFTGSELSVSDEVIENTNKLLAYKFSAVRFIGLDGALHFSNTGGKAMLSVPIIFRDVERAVFAKNEKKETE